MQVYEQQTQSDNRQQVQSICRWYNNYQGQQQAHNYNRHKSKVIIDSITITQGLQQTKHQYVCEAQEILQNIKQRIQQKNSGQENYQQQHRSSYTVHIKSEALKIDRHIGIEIVGMVDINVAKLINSIKAMAGRHMEKIFIIITPIINGNKKMSL